MSMAEQNLARHPMRVVIRRTGLSPDLLRAWEKRYQVVEPRRSEGGQRLYSDADIDRLTLLKRATVLGRNIGQVADLAPDALRRLVRDDEEARQPALGAAPTDAATAAGHYLQAALRAVERFDARGLEGVLRLAAISLPVATLMEQVIAPLLSQVGARWHQGTLRAAHEHLASVSARRVLYWIASEAGPSDGAPVIVVTTPAGQVHEIGALLAAATAATEGWRVVYLGPDLPAEDIAAAATQTGARAVALSVVFPLDDPAVHAQLRQLTELLGSGVTLMVGGGAAESYRATLDRAGARIAPDLGQLRTLLQSLSPVPAGS